MKKILSIIICLATLCAMVPVVAYADSETVVTIGADLTNEQKDKMYQYFGVDKNKVTTIEVTNKEEREYLEGVATEAQIGRRTLSCAYIQETEEGNGINVKIANLNMVTSSMIATTLSTAGIYNCNVVAACPIEVSGTGALTGIMKAFEAVTGEKLEEDKKELATEELVATADLAEELDSNDKATGIITAAKEAVIKSGTKDKSKIEDIIRETAKAYGVELTDEQMKMILEILLKVAKQDYDYDKLKSTLEGISSGAAKKLDLDIDFSEIGEEEAKGLIGAVTNFFEAIAEFFKGIGNWFSGLFDGNSEDKVKTESGTTDEKTDLGILNNTDESILGDDVITNSTDESAESTQKPKSTEDTSNEIKKDEVSEDSSSTENSSDSTAETQAPTATEEASDASASSVDVNN